jgi:hypothetical protein
MQTTPQNRQNSVGRDAGIVRRMFEPRINTSQNKDLVESEKLRAALVEDILDGVAPMENP